MNQTLKKNAGKIRVTKPKGTSFANAPCKFKGKAYEEWVKCFEDSLDYWVDARKGLDRWIRGQEAIARKFDVPWRDDCRKYVLERLHTFTSPHPHFEQTTRKKQEHTKKALKDVLSSISSLAINIRNDSGGIATDYGYLDMSELLDSLDSAARNTRQIIEVLDRQHSRQPKIIDQYAALMMHLESYPAKESHSLALLAMKAHGYEDSELTPLDFASIRTGTLRKHRKDMSRRFGEFYGIVPQKENSNS